MKKYVFMMFGVVLLAACNDQAEKPNGLQGLESFKVSQQDLDGILKSKGLKNAKGKREERMLNSFQERNAIASIVINDNLVDLDAVRVEIKRQRNEAIIKNYFDAFIKKSLSEDAIKQYYDAHIDEFTDKKAHIAHILLRVPRSANKVVFATIKKRAEELADQIRRGGDFSDAAKANSDDSITKDAGGDLGWVYPGKGEPALASVALGLNIDDIPNPVQSSQGFHIIKLLEPIKKDVKPFSEVKPKISYKMGYDAKVKELKRLKELARNEAGKLR